MNIDTAFPSKYLKAADFSDGARDLPIVRVAVEPVGKERLMKPVVFFKGEEKGLVLNKTNALKIASILGSKDTRDWVGRNVTLYPTEVEFSGESIEAIRVKRSDPDDEPFSQKEQAPGGYVPSGAFNLRMLTMSAGVRSIVEEVHAGYQAGLCLLPVSTDGSKRPLIQWRVPWEPTRINRVTS